MIPPRWRASRFPLPFVTESHRLQERLLRRATPFSFPLLLPEDDHSLENERALISLCTKLQLTQTQITSLLDLLPLEETTPITFEVFRDVLVSYLEERKEDFPQMNGLNAESGNNNRILIIPMRVL
ncbi:Hypothetical protein FKW44_012346 [Caligus rogercresseyi]|uniref:Uncharacterized protein n=1 Tax=Caligus rogercresseyi TaxID=217165 RepID=A0A7T8HJ82_CALRO|nr:Hypothetical protein FKW44_012346 [Caligus rogercresseyi]